MTFDITKDIVLSLGIMGLFSKILWDWIQNRLVNKDPKSPSNGDTEKISLNGRFKTSDLAEMLALQKISVNAQADNATRLDEVKTDIKTNQEVLRRDFEEAFSRIRNAEFRIGAVEGDIKVLEERTKDN